MNTLSVNKIQDRGLQNYIREIVALVDPVKILLLSARYCYTVTESIFHKNPVQDLAQGAYHLLVLTAGDPNPDEARRLFNIWSKLMSFKDSTIEFMDIEAFYARITAGDEHYGYILLNAMTSYDRGDTHVELQDSLLYPPI